MVGQTVSKSISSKYITHLSAHCIRFFTTLRLVKAVTGQRLNHRSQIKTFRSGFASSPSIAMLASKHISGPRFACTWHHGILGICRGFSPCNLHPQKSKHASNKFASLQNDQPYAQSSASWVCICKGVAAQPSTVQKAIDRMRSAACKAT